MEFKVLAAYFFPIRRFLCLCPAFVTAVVCALGCGKTDDSKKNGDPPPVVERKGPGPLEQTPAKPLGPDHIITSIMYADDHKQDSKAFRKKYADKLIELTGVIV